MCTGMWKPMSPCIWDDGVKETHMFPFYSYTICATRDGRCHLIFLPDPPANPPLLKTLAVSYYQMHLTKSCSLCVPKPALNSKKGSNFKLYWLSWRRCCCCCGVGYQDWQLLPQGCRRSFRGVIAAFLCIITTTILYRIFYRLDRVSHAPASITTYMMQTRVEIRVNPAHARRKVVLFAATAVII